MSKIIAILPVLLLCLLGTVLGLGSAAIPEETAIQTEAEEPVYCLDKITTQNVFAAEDGSELARYSYQLLTLSVSNLETLSEADQRNIDNFNAKMTGLMDSAVESGMAMGEDALALYGNAQLDYYDETTASGYFSGQYISVRINYSSYTGGAHPNRYVYSCLFDLRTGQFMDPLQIADDPEGFRSKTAEVLTVKAEALPQSELYWSDYAETLSRWNEGTVLFDADGMLVVYSPYELGPYSMGEVELRVGYEELAELAGPASLERLGLAR